MPRTDRDPAWKTLRGTQMSKQYASGGCYDDLGQSSCQKPDPDTKTRNQKKAKSLTMREVFQGWRRKLGGITLLLALVAVGAWCRSLYQVDVVTIECGLSRQMFASTEGRLVWDQRQIQMLGRRGTARFSLTLRIDVSETGDRSRFRYLDNWSIKWRRRGWGFDFGEASQLSGAHVNFRAVPYWSIVFALTLLSACLLLWKPRKRGVAAAGQRESAGTGRHGDQSVSPAEFNYHPTEQG